MYSADEQLVSQTLAGDRDAFGVLVHRYQEMVFAYAFQKVRNEVDAEDIMQEVFLRAYRNLYSLRHPHRFRSWLYTIMSNECNRWLARAAKTHRSEVQLAHASDDDLRVQPGHTVPTEGWKVDLEQAIAALSDENRVAVSMFYMGDCTLKEISDFLGVSVNTVKTKLHRARQQLGRSLSERYGKVLKSRKLRGGFLMQMMEQLRHTPMPTMGFAWSGATVGKTAFSLITVLCILIGLVGGREESPTNLSVKQARVVQANSARWPIEVSFVTPTISVSRSSITGIPVPSGERPIDTSGSRASMERSSRSDNRGMASPANGAGTPNSQFLATKTENGPEKLTFSGHVVDSNNEPIPDAEILCSVKQEQSQSITRTAADGTFRFELSRLELEGWADVWWEHVYIIATHPDYGIGWRNFPPRSRNDVEVQLDTPGSIFGTIINDTGAPIQNVKVQIKSVFSGTSVSGSSEHRLATDIFPFSPSTTNVNGEFVFRGLPQAAATNLEIQGKGYAKETRFRVPVGTEQNEFRLKREARIEGHLSYAKTGAPVKSATVTLARIRPTGPTEGREQASVDTNGNFSLSNLSPGVYNLYVEKAPKGWTASTNALIELAEGQTMSDIDLTLVRGGFITGRLTDRDTNEPIAPHYIEVFDAARPETQVNGHIVYTNKSGTYRFRAAPGPGVVIATAPKNYQGVGHIRKDVNVVEARSTTVNFQFSKGTGFVGRVLTEAGEPVEGAWITDISDRFGGRIEKRSKSDERGKFTVRGLRLGQKLALKAEHTGLKLRGTAEMEVRSGALIEIRMEQYEQVKVSGRVVSAGGRPISSVNIELMHSDPLLVDTRVGSIVAVTDGDGRFRGIELIVGDEYTISASAEGYRKTEAEMFTAAAEMTQVADLVLLPVLGRFFIEGRITDTSGEPVVGARVNTMQTQPTRRTLSDENGEYRLKDLSTAVVIQLHIFHPRYASHQFKILKTNRRHDLVLVKAEGYIAGKVVDTDGNPIEWAWVNVKAEESPSGYVYSPVRTNVQGEFELKHIKDSIVSIYVRDDHNSRTFEGIAVNQRDVVLTLTPPESKSEPTPEQLTRRKTQRAYIQDAGERFKTLINQPAQELAVEEWLAGPPVSVGDLKGKTIVLYFWDVTHSEGVSEARLLNLLQEAYGEQELACVAICPSDAETETIKQYLAEYSLAYSIGLDSPTDVVGAKGRTFDYYAAGWGLPIVLINSKGEISGRTWAGKLEDQIQTLLAD